MKDFRSLIGADAETIKNVRVQTCIDSVCDESRMNIMEFRKKLRNLQMERENLWILVLRQQRILLLM